MADQRDLLSLILEKASVGEPVSIIRLIDQDGTSLLSVLWRGEFTPPIERRLSQQLSERIRSLEAGGGIADLFTVKNETGREVRVALEVVRPKLRLLVFGAGHVGQATALMGAMLGYQVVVVDDRQEFLTRKRFPDPRIELLPHRIEGAAAAAGITSRTAVVIVTRGHQSDEACLKSVLGSRAIYIGMIGSRRRVLGVIKKLSSEGFAEEEFGRLHAPIGLKIGARTPQEIAIAILGEIIDCINNPKPEKRERADGV